MTHQVRLTRAPILETQFASHDSTVKIGATKYYLGGFCLPIVQVYVMVHGEADCPEYLVC